jgi:hypothetical protein
VFVRTKKQRRDQTHESLRGVQKYKSRNECGFLRNESLSVRTAIVKAGWLCPAILGESQQVSIEHFHVGNKGPMWRAAVDLELGARSSRAYKCGPRRREL